MKAKLIDNSKQNNRELPALYQNNAGDVVLFVEERSGIFVEAEDPGDLSGSFTDSFSSCHDEKVWKRLPTGVQVVFTQE